MSRTAGQRRRGGTRRRSDLQFLGVERSLQRAWAKGAGLIDEEFERPMIAVVNTCQEFSPENVHLRQVGDAVKAGIRMAGGTPCEFNAFHVTDSETFASAGMRYVLPSRDLVADMIELMVEGHRFDAMVLIASGDKVVPGMAMAAARLDLPAIMLYGGPTRAGVHKGHKVFLETVYDGVGQHLRGALDRQELKALEDSHFPFPGASDTATSGNTAGIYTEALGLALPGTGTLPAAGSHQLRAAKRAGMRIMDLVREDLRPSAILTRQAFENAMRVGMAVGGSTNMVLHMTAIAREAGVEVDFDSWDRLSRDTPTLVALAPSGPWGVTDLGDAGGVPAVLRALGDLVHADARTVGGGTVGEIADAAVNENPACVRGMDDPVEADGAINVPEGQPCAGRRRGQGLGGRPRHAGSRPPGPRLRGRGRRDRGHSRQRNQPRHLPGDPQRGPARRARHARDAGRHLGADGGGSRKQLRPCHRRTVLRGHARPRHRLRHPGSGTRRPDRARQGRRHGPHRPSRAQAGA